VYDDLAASSHRSVRGEAEANSAHPVVSAVQPDTGK
jgi:hypothetical protein